MRAILGLATIAALLTACDRAPQPRTLAEIRAVHDWQAEPGDALVKSFNEELTRIFAGKTRDEILSALNEAAYNCIYGEAHEDYPEPAAQCTTSFATRACQFDWEVFIVTDDGKTTHDGSFTRDCVGRSDDYPVPVDSAIDDQLAPFTPPPETTTPEISSTPTP